jgi:uncharacterized glyoxalase superfamily protein PhnB
MTTGPSVIAGLFYDDPNAALGDGVVAVRQSRGHSPHDSSPRAASGVNTAHVSVAVPDVDAYYARVQQAGALVLEPLSDKFYGLRSYAVEDCEGHRWTFESNLSTPPPTEPRWKRNEGHG